MKRITVEITPHTQRALRILDAIHSHHCALWCTLHPWKWVGDNFDKISFPLTRADEKLFENISMKCHDNDY